MTYNIYSNISNLTVVLSSNQEKILAEREGLWFSLYATHYSTIPPQNMTALRALNKMLANYGIRLVIQVIPDARFINARIMFPEFRNCPETSSLSLARQLLEADIEAIYSADELVKNYNRSEFLFSPAWDKHPGDGAQYILTENMATYLHKYFPAAEFTPLIPKHCFSIQKKPTVSKMVFPLDSPGNNHKKGEAVQSDYIFYNGEEFFNGEFGRKKSNSKILIAGNSYVQHPTVKQHAYTAHLSMAMQYMAFSAIQTSDCILTTLLAKIYKNQAWFLNNRKVMIVPISVIHLSNLVSFFNVDIAEKLNQLDECNKAELDKTHIGIARQNFSEKQKKTEADFMKKFGKEFEVYVLPDKDKYYEIKLIIPPQYRTFPSKFIVADIRNIVHSQKLYIQTDKQERDISLDEKFIMPVPDNAETIILKFRSSADMQPLAVGKVTLYY